MDKQANDLTNEVRREAGHEQADKLKLNPIRLIQHLPAFSYSGTLDEIIWFHDMRNSQNKHEQQNENTED